MQCQRRIHVVELRPTANRDRLQFHISSYSRAKLEIVISSGDHANQADMPANLDRLHALLQSSNAAHFQDMIKGWFAARKRVEEAAEKEKGGD